MPGCPACVYLCMAWTINSWSPWPPARKPRTACPGTFPIDLGRRRIAAIGTKRTHFPRSKLTREQCHAFHKGGGGPVVSLLSERKKNGETPSKQLDEIHAQISQNAKAPRGLDRCTRKPREGHKWRSQLRPPKRPHILITGSRWEGVRSVRRRHACLCNLFLFCLGFSRTKAASRTNDAFATCRAPGAQEIVPASISGEVPTLMGSSGKGSLIMEEKSI